MLGDWWRRRRASTLDWDRRIQDRLVAQLPTLAQLPTAAHQRLADLTAQFLVDKRFHAAHGMPLTDQHRISIATLACWPALHLGYAVLKGWTDVIVYPDAFRAHRQVHEEGYGLAVVHEFDEELSGEAWEGGPVILGWEQIREDLAHPQDGLSVVIHEIAHKIDERSGAINGMPLLAAGHSRSDWTGCLQEAYADLCARVELDLETAIDPYAAEAPEEFFAVCCEYLFLRPDLLQTAYPPVYQQLRRYFGEISAT